ncbi:sensor histidine kinase [Nocardioides zeae]|uniref:histidine kinase n=1 Tax=Nocardioides zeae TaxID=1457234 RepID=A0AAJ1U441_9ACTN|nr:HAMP domain-containing sensor histidine kinase [Nocardioides zeae]MDQ1105228.1 signal transduction histidine kinase [Nocardioides zeae]
MDAGSGVLLVVEDTDDPRGARVAAVRGTVPAAVRERLLDAAVVRRVPDALADGGSVEEVAGLAAYALLWVADTVGPDDRGAAEQGRRATAARAAVRAAVAAEDPGAVLAASESELLRAMGARAVKTRIYEGVPGTDALHAIPSRLPPVPEALQPTIRRVMGECWRTQETWSLAADDLDRVVELSDDRYAHLLLGGWIVDLARIGLSRLLLAPVGAGDDCLGAFSVFRGPDDPPWSDAERTTALDLGHDLGQVVLAARARHVERRAAEELRRLEQYRGRMITTLAHELRTPLTTISAALDLMAAPADGDLDGAAYIRRGVDLMGSTIDNLLVVTQAQAPRATAATPCDVATAARWAVEAVEVAAEAKSIHLGLEVPDDAPLVLADPTDLGHVLSNLVGNAVKYTPHGGRIRVAVVADAAHVRIEVHDTGIGISEGDQRHLFAEFFRSTNPAALEQSGSGLGLTIVRRLVERLGGRVAVESELGRGSCFSVELPRA